MGIGRDQMAPACLSYPGRTSHAQGIAAALIATATNKNAVVLGVLALWRELDLRPLPIPRRYCFQISASPLYHKVIHRASELSFFVIYCKNNNNSF